MAFPKVATTKEQAVESYGCMSEDLQEAADAVLVVYEWARAELEARHARLNTTHEEYLAIRANALKLAELVLAERRRGER